MLTVSRVGTRNELFHIPLGLQNSFGYNHYTLSQPGGSIGFRR